LSGTEQFDPARRDKLVCRDGCAPIRYGGTEIAFLKQDVFT
jgi:hypothetical protein